MTDILSLFPGEIEELIVSIGEKRFRASQVFSWLYKGVKSFSDMSNIPKELIAKLSESAQIKSISIEEKFVSQIDGTVKYLYRLDDGEMIETVFMRYKHGNTICLSTQAGCKMGCDFCASTINGFRRNLLPSEMLLQIMCCERDLAEKVSNIVLMGIGEPLDNYDNVVRFLRLVNNEKGLNIGMRHISLSTCGIADKIDRLAQENLPITLSVSLHASDQKKREEIMPVARKWSLEQLLASCRQYIKKTGRRISFEYALISGVNDSGEEADRLGKLLSGMLCHVNLIPVNPVKEKSFKKSEKSSIEVFTRTIEKYRISVTVRRRLGSDINASCGQLRANHSS
ncbi:MAG: 23S rRNA (adenine(2503)-C(2))-methyltransferase RlmN [Eubacteriales bacterium]|nr:23S rRNA (adenine(2503)-C(2))-methyltransferase RlmN [Eubacteriales bacterium]MDD4421602.1 23S rRNA (adenine(2503)-C(2))-methyltransferase RlmN [Eubacteriales bacterium]HBR31728.1 23S rRNA (adenine(2503)-C(2))-methyltransferase RlmN [Clostridiales bacterium]